MFFPACKWANILGPSSSKLNLFVMNIILSSGKSHFILNVSGPAMGLSGFNAYLTARVKFDSLKARN